MSSMNFTCDVCGREVFSCTFVNGMKFCAKCYQETFGETDKDRKIADLEAKLAESERKLEEYKKCNCKECMTDYEKNLNQIIDKFLNENIKLKQQLAEKTLTIEQINKAFIENRSLWKGKYERANQDKISFAVEKLEQVKETTECILDNALKNSSLNESYYDRLLDEIDNQIKQLKEMSNEK